MKKYVYNYICIYSKMCMEKCKYIYICKNVYVYTVYVFFCLFIYSLMYCTVYIATTVCPKFHWGFSLDAVCLGFEADFGLLRVGSDFL